MKLVAFVALAAVAVAQDAPPTGKGRGKGGAPGGGRGKGGGGASLNEFNGEGPCKGAIMIFARGSTEPGNVGMIIGPPLFSQLRRLVPDIAIQGVPYAAGLGTNMVAGGADPKGVEAASKLFNLAATKCPNAAVVGGGYSQGAAVMHRSVEKLSKEVQGHIAGIVTYGDTQNKQDGGQIKNFPKEKVKVFCNPSDGVCGGALAVNAGHMSYGKDMAPGAQFLAERIKAWQAAKGSGSSESPEPAAEAAETPTGDAAPSAAPPPGKFAGKGAKGGPRGGKGKAPFGGKGPGGSDASNGSRWVW